MKSGILRAASDENLPPSEYRAFHRKQTFHSHSLLALAADRVSVGGMAGTRYEMAG